MPLEGSDDSNSETLILHHSKSETFIQTCKDVANLCRCNRCSAATVAIVVPLPPQLESMEKKAVTACPQEWYFSLFGQKKLQQIKKLRL